MLYYANRISDNMYRREPEGYLICVNVPIARTGTQEYLQDEIGGVGEAPVKVFRPEEEVFSRETMASFEGMPVTNDHPNDENGVTVDNIEYLQKGHCQNVHRGTGDEKDLLIADLVIKDKGTIQEVLDGKREISCGYTYELCEENGRYVQRQIRGNHVAIVDRGRAGHRVCIKDAAPNDERRKTKMAKKNHAGILARMLATFVASDAEPQELEEAVDTIEEITSEHVEAPAAPAVEETHDDGEDPIAQILARLDALEAKVNGTDEEPEAPEADPLAKLEADLDELEGAEEPEEPINPEEDEDEPEAHYVDPEEINEQDEDEGEEAEVFDPEAVDCRAHDSVRAAIKAIKPLIAKLPPKEQKKAAADAAAALRKEIGLSGKAVRNDYAKLLKTRKRTGDSRKAKDPTDIGKAIMAKRNPNYKK